MKNCTQVCGLSCALRVAAGVSVALVGLVHYMEISAFAGFVSGGLGALAPLGKLWAYILPALQIVGGLWFAFYKKNPTPGLLLGIAFASTAIGVLLKPVLSDTPLAGPDGVMGAAQNAMLWLVFVLIAAMCSKCAGSCDMEKKM